MSRQADQQELREVEHRCSFRDCDYVAPSAHALKIHRMTEHFEQQPKEDDDGQA